MRTATQLETVAPPPAVVLAFPPMMMSGRARRLAVMCSKSSPGAQRYLMRWEFKKIEDAMEAAGMPLDERDQQIDAFVTMTEQHYAALTARTGDAA